MGGKKFIRHGRLDEVTQKGKSLLWYYILHYSNPHYLLTLNTI